MSSTGDCCGCCFLCCSCFSICGHSSLLRLCFFIPCCRSKDASDEEGSEGDAYSGDRQMYEDRHREATLFQSQPIAANDMKTSTDLSSNPNAIGNIRDKSLIRLQN
ncbi:uncharacterized protein LACBIDRAFT_298280 [Laccaria bicolor S238N-H82]|uniref:Predicted protein n=1 Tax=Laccaria bicolor (strain S238N-H82 / ATCC MYA-4686) TaxID=486041 RepID=B0DCN2_LACBS|nr:uncharacterized protein LACBIDRAFT_298280 [Laccaria bicolor S238N-H82]EDR07761.1 predicted protein [Laccaria bicolor S238N-H82]|eukprot:XP_001881550.1 predicted protein [Laccaria bicolor S238N-H82]